VAKGGFMAFPGGPPEDLGSWFKDNIVKKGLGTDHGDATDAVDNGYREAIAHGLKHGLNVVEAGISYRFGRSAEAAGAGIRDAVADGVPREGLFVVAKGGFMAFPGGPPEDLGEWFKANIVKKGLGTPDELAGDQLIMSRIALWGPIIPIGLAAATLSSAIGSILVAPRTLQALGADGILPFSRANSVVAAGEGEENEPRNATLVTAVIALVTVALGNVDLVARIVSMFFMVTYGALCAISFLEHFAARPSYRPSFRSKWYLSFWGAVLCLLLMFQMDPVYAVLAIVVMVVLYRTIRATRKDEVDDLSAIFHGVMTQLTRYLQIRLQKSPPRDWRPSVIMITGRTFDRFSPLRMLSWICHRYGFGTYLHFIKGMLNRENIRESRKIVGRLIEGIEETDSAIYVDTIISPSMASALAQSLQVPGVSGMENNTILFEFSNHDSQEVMEEVLRGCILASAPGMNRLILRHGDHFFGNRKTIHLWLTWHDYRNANLMILLSYILLGHPEWEGGEISIKAAFPYSEVPQQTARLNEMITQGRLPIAKGNLQIFPTDDRSDFGELVRKHSAGADLVILGFTEERLQEKGADLLLRHPDLRDVLFVSAEETIFIE